MSRIQSIVSRPKRTLAALATVLVAVGITAASGADFTAQSANASNTFTAGSLTMDNSEGAGAILSATGMKPGDATTNAVGTVVIKNTGTLAGTFTLGKSALTDTPSSPAMSGKLNVTVIDCGTGVAATCAVGDPDVYTGTLAAMGTGIDLGSFAGGEEHLYEFTVALDSSADNTYQNGSSLATFLWQAA